MQAHLIYVPGVAVNTPTLADQYGQFFIGIYDDAGNPTNGDNATVYYTQLNNGVPGSVQNVTIAGQQQLIYSGIVQHDTRPATEGSLQVVDFTLTGRIDAGTPAPPLTPDIAIQSITILTKADLNSHKGGSIRINATSSYLPLRYQIDAVAIVDDPVLGGIGGGQHTITVYDAMNYQAQTVFLMPEIAAILVSDPSFTLNGKVSRWNAAFNPIVFKFSRKDYTVLGITQDPSSLKPLVSLDADIGDLSIGDFVYLDYSPYKAPYKVLNIISSSVVIDTPYVAPIATSGFANIDALRPYYKISMLITYVDPATGLFNTIEATQRPINGITTVDISSLLQSILSPRNDKSTYSAINYRDAGLSASYTVQYAETWENNPPVYFSITTPFYVTWAAMQIKQKGNLYNYVTQAGGVQLAKWLPDFNEPLYTPGYPFDLPFIYSEQIAGRQLYYKIILLDINRTPLDVQAFTSYLLNDDGSYILNQDGSKFIIAQQNLVNTPIVEYVGLNRLLINQDYGSLCWYLSVQLFYNDNTTPVPVTVAQIVRVDKNCLIRPVFVRWIGFYGTWNYFRFNYDQPLSLDIQNAVIIKDFVSDYETAEGIERVISKDASTKLTVSADAIDTQTMRGLQSIKSSPMVQQFINGQWLTVIVNSATFTEGTSANEYNDFAITFNNPSLNVQTQ